MSDFEQPGAAAPTRRVTAEDLATRTMVTKFSLTPTVFTLTVTRPDSEGESYERRTLKTIPSAADIPADYLAAVNQWIAGTLR